MQKAAGYTVYGLQILSQATTTFIIRVRRSVLLCRLLSKTLRLLASLHAHFKKLSDLTTASTINMAEDKPPRPALDDPDAYVLYRYYPSQVASIIFVVLFGLTTMLHLFQLVKKRTWYFIPLVVGGACKYHSFIGHAHF